jgi:hypothetical protein
MQAHFINLRSKNFPMVNLFFQSNEFWRLKSPSENLEVHRDSNSQNEYIWECEGSFPHIMLHSYEHEMWFLGFTLGSHLCKLLPWLQAQV